MFAVVTPLTLAGAVDLTIAELAPALLIPEMPALDLAIPALYIPFP